MDDDRSQLTRASAQTPEALSPGAMLGSYRIERLLGRGGMGAVFLAHDTTLHRHVAVKVVGREADDEGSRDRLIREARSAAALNHPGICTIYEIGATEGTAFIAMEYVSGRSLHDLLGDGRLPVDEALALGIQAADALAYAHDHGVVHRDFKAANIIVYGRGSSEGRRFRPGPSWRLDGGGDHDDGVAGAVGSRGGNPLRDGS